MTPTLDLSIIYIYSYRLSIYSRGQGNHAGSIPDALDAAPTAR